MLQSQARSRLLAYANVFVIPLIRTNATIFKKGKNRISPPKSPKTIADMVLPPKLLTRKRVVTAMLDNSTIKRLHAMKTNVFVSELERQIDDSGSCSQLVFEECLRLLVDIK